jgi:hypothetical protein
LQASLTLYPRYAAALEEMGKLWIDRGVYESLGLALQVFGNGHFHYPHVDLDIANRKITIFDKGKSS